MGKSKNKTEEVEKTSEETKAEEVEKTSEENKGTTLKVDKPFTDKYDETIKYKVGDTLTIDEERRIKNLTKRGLAHIVK